MKTIKLKSVVVILFCVVFTQNSFAGFPIGNGRWLLVPTYTRYSATSYWDNMGTLKNPTNPADNFVSNYFGLYGGFGVGRDVDLIFNIPYVNNSTVRAGAPDGPLNTTGDVTVGLVWFLNHYDYYKHLSLTTSLIVPTYQNFETTLLPGFASVGAEAKLGLCGTNTTSWKDSYYDLEGGLRYYFNNGGPVQLFANATIGIPLDEDQDWKATGILNFVSSSSSLDNTTSSNVLNPALNYDFSYLRASMGLGKKLSRNVTLWATIFKDVTGRNIGQGSGFSIYTVIKF